jgi:hypothetical protein
MKHNTVHYHRWRKPVHETLTTQQYFADYKEEQLLDGANIQVFRGLGDNNFLEMHDGSKTSLAGSIMAKFSIGSNGSVKMNGASVNNSDDRSLLRKDSEEVSDLEGVEVSFL